MECCGLKFAFSINPIKQAITQHSIWPGRCCLNMEEPFHRLLSKARAAGPCGQQHGCGGGRGWVQGSAPSFQAQFPEFQFLIQEMEEYWYYVPPYFGPLSVYDLSQLTGSSPHF